MLQFELWSEHNNDLYKSPSSVRNLYSKLAKNEIEWYLLELYRFQEYTCTWRDINSDNLDPAKINLIIIPYVCIRDFSKKELVSYLKTYFNPNVVKFIKNCNITVLFTWTFETMIEAGVSADSEQVLLRKILQYFVQNKIEKHLKFFDNRYDNYDLHLDLRPFWIYPKTKNNMLSRYEYAAEVIHTQRLRENKEFKYDFCIPIGRLNSNFYRCLMLLELQKHNMLDCKNVFHTAMSGGDNVPEDEFFKHSVKFTRDCLEQYKIPDSEKVKYYDMLNDPIAVKNIFKAKAITRTGQITHSKTRHNADQYFMFPQALASRVNVVLETREYDQSLTEKTLKCLKHGLPFLLYARQGAIQHLIDEGYKMYPWIDYSYDNIKTNEERFYAFMDELVRLWKTRTDNTLSDNACSLETLKINLHNKSVYQQKVVDMMNNVEKIW